MKEIKLIIDPGHGGYDLGLKDGDTYNKGYNGCLEKDINLEVANRLAWFCAHHDLGYLITRYGDRFISLQDRTALANKTNASLFLSIHCNYSRNPVTQGFEVWHHHNSSVGKRWAEALCASFDRLKFTRNRGAKCKEHDFYVLKHTRMPAILIECGFLSAKSDCEKLCTPDFQTILAETIFETICGIGLKQNVF